MNMNKARYSCVDFVFAAAVLTGIWTDVRVGDTGL